MHKILLLFLILPVAFLTSEIIIHVTPESLAHTFRHELAQLESDLTNFSPPSITTNYLELSVTAENMTITNIQLPKISHNGVHMVLIGGGAKINGDYLIVYKTRRTGKFEFILDGVDFNVVNGESCGIEVATANLTFTTTQPEQIIAKLKSELLSKIQSSFCNRVETQFLSKMDLFKFTDISQGDKPSHHKVEIDYYSTPEDSPVTTVDVEITESVINSELAKLYTTANTVIHWPLGLAANEALTSKLAGEPTIRINEKQQVVLRLPLTTVLLRDETEVSRNSGEIEALLSDITISRPKQGLVHWTANYEILKSPVFRKGFSIDKTELQKLLHKHLRGSLPIEISSKITWSHHAVAKAHTNSLHFHISPHFAKKSFGLL